MTALSQPKSEVLTVNGLCFSTCPARLWWYGERKVMSCRRPSLEQFREIANDLEGRSRMKRKFSVFIFVVFHNDSLFQRSDFR